MGCRSVETQTAWLVLALFIRSVSMHVAFNTLLGVCSTNIELRNSVHESRISAASLPSRRNGRCISQATTSRYQSDGWRLGKSKGQRDLWERSLETPAPARERCAVESKSATPLDALESVPARERAPLTRHAATLFPSMRSRSKVLNTARISRGLFCVSILRLGIRTYIEDSIPSKSKNIVQYSPIFYLMANGLIMHNV